VIAGVQLAGINHSSLRQIEHELDRLSTGTDQEVDPQAIEIAPLAGDVAAEVVGRARVVLTTSEANVVADRLLLSLYCQGS
jgi:hypothetical protein